MSDEIESVEDLIALSRRGELSKAQARRLEARLAGSPEDRVLREAARGFDLEPSVEALDALQIERLARRFQKSGSRPVLSRQRRVALAAAATLLLACAMGVGAMQLFGANPRAPSSATNASPSRAPATPATPGAVRRVVPEEPARNETPTPVASAATTVSPPSESRGALSNARRPESVLRSAPSAEVPAERPGESPGDLFAAGNHARSRGDVTTALSFYQRLESEYPAASESLAARISIGMLELQRGQADAALAEFKAYRQANARALRAEALWGEAEALRSLGRVGEEQAVLEELLRDHPSSVYASTARKRLGKD